MRAAIVNNAGIVENIIVLSDLSEYPGAVACPDHVGIGMPIDAPVPENDFFDLSAKKAAKYAQIERDRDTAATANVVVFGRPWTADTRSQILLGQAITLANAGLPLPPGWRDANDEVMPITSINDLLAIAGAIAEQVQYAYAQSWARKDALAAATTPEEVDAV